MAFHALIMAGGGGTRLWPLSRRSRPKQSLALADERTMFEHAVHRLAPIFQPENILIVTGKEHVAQLMQQAPELPQESFIVEPMGRGTAPAIGLGAAHLQERDPEAVMVVLTADHFIQNEERFRQTLIAASKIAQQGHLVTLGITPAFPSTAYGYIQQGEWVTEIEGLAVYNAERFTEKPSEETAFQMVESGHYSWNSGMFIWRVDRVMEEFEKQMPDFYAQLSQIAPVLGKPAYESTLQRVWPEIIPQTIDYGIMEGAEDVIVIPVDIGWSDVGNWSSMQDILPIDPNGNVVVGDHLGIDTQNTIIFSKHRLVATIGLTNMIVVDTDEAVLICPREREQEVREMVRRLKEMDRQELL